MEKRYRAKGGNFAETLRGGMLRGRTKKLAIKWRTRRDMGGINCGTWEVKDVLSRGDRTKLGAT